MPTEIDRRHFLKGLGGFVVATAAGPLVLDAAFPGSAGADVVAGDLPLGTPICVLVVMDGGNDALNTLAPVDDSWYFDAAAGHGPLALDPATTLALSGLASHRLHPRLRFLADRWNGPGDVAFLTGVGETDHRNFSHFDSMAYWQTADTSLERTTGWLGRYNDVVRPGQPMAAIGLGGARREIRSDTAPALVVRDTEKFEVYVGWVDPARTRSSLDRMASTAGDGTLRGAAAAMIGSTFAASAKVKGASDRAVTGDPEVYKGFHGLSKALLQGALLIRAGIPCQTYVTSFGPFDSHNDQHAMQGARFAELDDALTRFFAALAGHPREADVFVTIVSEFGRQATANKTSGTDHGQAGLAVMVGGGVRRGLYGEFPTLDPGGPTRPNRIHDALKPTVDFRGVHSTVLDRLSGDPAVTDTVLGRRFEAFDVF